MISARQFCRESEFPIAVFLTYSFDPLFFERIPWADLGIGGSRRIVVAADAGQVVEAMHRCIGQIAYLGRRYGDTFEMYRIPQFNLPRLLLLDLDGRVFWEGDPGFAAGTAWQEGDDSIIRAEAPLAEMISYGSILRAITQGRGSFHMEMGHYEEVPRPLQEKLIAERAKNRKVEVVEE